MKFKKLLLGTALAVGTVFAVGATSASADEVYTVQPSDTLSKISIKFAGDNSLINSIAQTNHIKNQDMIYAGEKLTIVTDGAKTASAPAEKPASDNGAASYSAPQNQPSQPQANQQVQSNQQSETAASTATSSDSSSAKEWIANKESSGSYSARNGQYIGRYQLSASYLNGDYSEANQEKVADQYVSSRYGSWEAAQSFWQANGWY